MTAPDTLTADKLWATSTLRRLPPPAEAERRAGLMLLRELARGRPPERALRAVPRRVLRLLVSAYQSRLFNRLVDARLDALDRLERGDLAYLNNSGPVFLVEDNAMEQPHG